MEREPSEKLGDYLVRRRDPLPLAGSAVLAALGWVFIWLTPMRWRGPYQIYWIAGFAGICIVVLLIGWANQVRCPKCRANLKAIAPKAIAQSYSGKCPQCGASFDEPYAR
jgi:hypothetical protein